MPRLFSVLYPCLNSLFQILRASALEAAVAALSASMSVADQQCSKVAGHVANLTLRPQLTPMHIITLVASIARTRHIETVNDLLLMAGIAIGLLVSAIEFELGTRVMIKVPRLP